MRVAIDRSTEGRTAGPSAGPTGTADVSSPEGRASFWRRLPYGIKAKVGVGLLLVGAWEAAIRLVAPPYMARPTGIAAVLPGVVSGEPFREALAGTIVPILQGLIIAISVAILVGLAMAQLRWLGWALRSYTYAFFALPMVAAVPLITMWLGYSEASRLAIVVFAAYFPMVLNVYDGARAVPERHLEVAHTYRAPRRAIWFGVVLPSSIPYLLAGFRLAAGRALVAAVVAEYLLGIPGLGYFILLHARTFRHDEAFVAVLTLAALGVLILVLARWATRRLAPWYAVEHG